MSSIFTLLREFEKKVKLDYSVKNFSSDLEFYKHSKCAGVNRFYTLKFFLSKCQNQDLKTFDNNEIQHCLSDEDYQFFCRHSFDNSILDTLLFSLFYLVFGRKFKFLYESFVKE